MGRLQAKNTYRFYLPEPSDPIWESRVIARPAVEPALFMSASAASANILARGARLEAKTSGLKHSSFL